MPAPPSSNRSALPRARRDRRLGATGAFLLSAAVVVSLLCSCLPSQQRTEIRSLGTGVLLVDPFDGLLLVRNAEAGVEVARHDGQRFVPLGPAGPFSRADFGVTLDEARRRVVLFGGQDPFEGICFDDTWVFELETQVWRELGGSSPGERAQSRLFYDRRSDEVFLAGGQAVRCGGRVHHDGFVLVDTGWRPVFAEIVP